MAAATSLDVTPSDILHTYRHPWALLVTAGKRLGNVTCSLDCVSRMGCESHLHMASAHMTSLRSVLRPLSKRTAQGPPQCDHQPVTQPSVEGKSLFSGINPVCSMWPCLHNSPSHAHRLRSSIIVLRLLHGHRMGEHLSFAAASSWHEAVELVLSRGLS